MWERREERRSKERRGERRREGKISFGRQLSVCACFTCSACTLSRLSLRFSSLYALAWLLLLPPETAERGREVRVRWLLFLAGLFCSTDLFSNHCSCWKEERREDERRDVERVGEKRRSVLVGSFLSVLALLPVLARSLVSRFAFRAGTL